MGLDLQKAGMGKRISAFLFDIILSACIMVLCLLIFSAVSGYDKYAEQSAEYIREYEEKYNIDIDFFATKSEKFESLSPEEQKRYEDANEAFAKDERVGKVWNTMVTLIIAGISLSLFFTALIWEFIIPLFLKNGQTVGKKIFGIAVMRVDGVKISTLQLFVRSILGKYTLETMIPALIFLMMLFGAIGILGSIIIIGIVILQCVLLIVTKNRSMVHDVIAATAVVDFSSQLIFDSTDDLINYKKGIAAKKAERSPY